MEKRRNLIISAILGICLIVLIVLIKTNYINNIDSAVYNMVVPMINNQNTNIVKGITFFGSKTFIILAVLFFLIIWHKSRRGLEVASIVIISTLINNIIKIIIQRPRPEILQLVIEKSSSFPSGHTMAITTLVGILIFLLWKGSLSKTKKGIISIVLGIIPFLIMFSRIYLGIHYFSDCLGGFITSIIILILFTTFLDKYYEKNNTPPTT